MEHGTCIGMTILNLLYQATRWLHVDLQTNRERHRCMQIKLPTPNQLGRPSKRQSSSGTNAPSSKRAVGTILVIGRKLLTREM